MKTKHVMTKNVNGLSQKIQVSVHTKIIKLDNSMKSLILSQNQAILAQMRVDFRGDLVPYPPKRVNLIKMSA